MVAIELLDMKANIAPLTSWEYHALSVAKGELMEIYLTKERNSIQKCELRRLKEGMLTLVFFIAFWQQRNDINMLLFLSFNPLMAFLC